MNEILLVAGILALAGRSPRLLLVREHQIEREAFEPEVEIVPDPAPA